MAFDHAIHTPLVAGRGERLITLTRGLVALIDEDDWPLIADRMWYAVKARSNWYARSDKGLRKTGATYLHRLIADAPKGKLVDHRNQNSLDCRRHNLIVVGRSTNAQNAVYESKTGYRGVYPSENGRFSAQITVNGKRITIGRFCTPELASEAYDKAARKHFGKHAWTNAKACELGLQSTALEFEDIPF